MKKITHLMSDSSDYTLCGFGSEEIDDLGIVSESSHGGEPLETYESMVAKRRWNTNCRFCQRAVENVLNQIKQ